MRWAHVLVEQRRHPRAQLRRPARFRWQGPLGMRLEITETIDVSRDGLLLHCREDPFAMTSRVWILFPFNATAVGEIEPETPARIVRTERDPSGGYRVGVQLQPPRRATRTPGQSERRTSPRVPFSLPIFVRPAGTPWPEETMTRDYSRTGVRFETSHIYTEGEIVLAKMPWGERAEDGEISGRIVRVEPVEHRPKVAENRPGSSAIFSCVAVQWIDPKASAKREGQACSTGRTTAKQI
jgi:hypothetical protein